MHDSLPFWRQQLRGVLLPELPADRRRDPTVGFSPGTLPLVVPPGLAVSIERLSREGNTSPPAILMAALQTFLFRYTGQSDVCVGVLLACESSAHFLPIRCDLQGMLSFRDLLTRIGAAIADAWQHRWISADDLAALLRADSDQRRAAGFPVTLAFEIEAAPTAAADLSLSLHETAQGLAGAWEYNATRFEETTVARMSAHFLTLLEAAVANPDESLSRLPLLSAAERHQILVEWNQTRVEYPRDRCLHDLFEEQAALHPERIAVVFRDEQLTYGELNTGADRLAHRKR